MPKHNGKTRGIFERPKGSGVWWVRWACSYGRIHREKIGPKGLARAEYEKRKVRVRSEKEQFCPTLKADRRPALFDEIAQDYLTYSRANKRSADDDPPRVRRLLKAFGGCAVSDIQAGDVERLKQELSEAGSAPATVNHYLKCLKAMFYRAIRAGKAEHNPVRGVKLLKENNARVRCLSEVEEARLYDALPDYLKPFLTVALHTGMRWGELAHLTWDDVDFYTGTLHVRQSKSGEGRRVPMNSIVRDTLHALRRERVQAARSQAEGEREILSPLVFCSPRGHFLSNFKRDWYPALRRAEIPDFRWHDTRHTAASRLVMAGVELYTVKEILGHETLQMTARYSHLSPGHQREALERLAARQMVSAGPIQGPTGTASSTGEMVGGAAVR
jgi:integrase